MKKKSIIVYSIFACIIYVLALSYFIFNLAYEFSNGANRTKRRFDHTAAAVQESMRKINSQMYDSNTIKELIITSFGSMNDFAYIEFSENGQTIYSYKINTLSDGAQSPLLHNYSNTFRVNDKEYYFTANLYNLRPSSIFLYGKRAFLVIFIVTIITFILIVITNVTSLESPSYERQIEESDENDITETKKQTIFDEVLDTTIVKNDDESTENQSDTNIDDDASKTAKVHSEEITEEPVLSDISEENKQELPEGLYSPDTGLSFEPFLETKLNNELTRSIASESDLSLFLIQFPELDKTSETFKQICNYLILQFQYKDLVFEYKTDSIAAIKVNSTIDEAITFADKIHSEIKNIINDESKAFYIGISSRTIRMVAADRLLLEADEALEHAKEDKKCPIIAFRADAEKFRLANL